VVAPVLDRSGEFVEVTLGPGDLHFGGGRTRIRTLLGSCVAVTLWHPLVHLGGMCHYMMPSRPATWHGNGARNGDVELSGRYADEALLLLLQRMREIGTPPEEYEVKVFGGGNQFSHHPVGPIDVATSNVDAALHLLEHHGLTPTAMHVRGAGHRQVILDLWSGHVWLRHTWLPQLDLREVLR
jgi:chemotaxis protein CheD